MSEVRQRPNILITGTPGTGKTTLCEAAAEATGFRHVNIGTWVKEHSLHSGWDDEYQCLVLDEDKVRAWPSIRLLMLQGCLVAACMERQAVLVWGEWYRRGVPSL